MAKEPKIHKFKDKKGEYRYSVKAANGEIVLPSEGYKTEAARDKTLDRLQTILASAVTVYDEDDTPA